MISITVKIADRPYRLKVNKDQEEVIRKAAKTIEEKCKEYGENYAYKDKQDLLAMVTLEAMTSSISYQQAQSFKEHQLTSRLNDIDELLAANLQKMV